MFVDRVAVEVAGLVGLDRAIVARIATVSRSGRPNVNLLYFVVMGDHIHLGTATYTLAAHDVAANSAVQILFEIESDLADRRIVRMDGAAVVCTDAALMKRYRSGVTRKYIATQVVCGTWPSTHGGGSPCADISVAGPLASST